MIITPDCVCTPSVIVQPIHPPFASEQTHTHTSSVAVPLGIANGLGYLKMPIGQKALFIKQTALARTRTHTHTHMSLSLWMKGAGVKLVHHTLRS